MDVMLIRMAMAGVMVVMPFSLEIVKKIPTDNAGTILLALPVGTILTAPLAGRLLDIIGTKKPIITALRSVRLPGTPSHLSLPTRTMVKVRQGSDLF